MKKLVSVLFLFLSVLTIGLGITSNALAAELTEAKFTTKIVDGNGQIYTNSPLTLRNDSNYTLNIGFDLSSYNGKLVDGDYLTYHLITAPLKIKTKDMVATDEVTGVPIADVSVVSNGANNGGTITVKLKNLEEYRAKLNSDTVRDVSDSFNVDFRITEVVTNLTIPLPGYSSGSKTMTISVPEKSNGGTYTGTGENFTKAGGLITRENWISAKLGRSGQYMHKDFNVRINLGQKDLSNFVLTDVISLEGFQFIPETFRLIKARLRTDTRGYYNDGTEQVITGSELEKYLTFNEDYTQFELNLGNIGTDQYMIDYSTIAKKRGRYNNCQPGLCYRRWRALSDC